MSASEEPRVPSERGTEPILAWRAWGILDGQLVSPYRGQVWPAMKRFEVNGDVGFVARHPMDTASLRGIHGFKTFGAVNRWMTIADTFLALKTRYHGLAYGKVSLWGRIVEHADGWRAQYAYPYSISAPEHYVSEIRSRYCVDVTKRLPAADLRRDY